MGLGKDPNFLCQEWVEGAVCEGVGEEESGEGKALEEWMAQERGFLPLGCTKPIGAEIRVYGRRVKVFLMAHFLSSWAVLHFQSQPYHRRHSLTADDAR